MNDGLAELDSFFTPEVIAVAGASVDKSKVGSIIYQKLRRNVGRGVLKAEVYAVNPKYDRVGSSRCYRDLVSLPVRPELLILAVPVSSVVELVDQAVQIGVKAILIISGGFGEAGRSDIERIIHEKAVRYGTRVLGPNTIGLLDPLSGVDTLFLPTRKRLPSGKHVKSLLEPKRGGVVIITQSGHLGEVIAEELWTSRVGVRAIVGVGNQLDVSVEDVLQYFSRDDATKVMALYLEGLKDGRRFLSVAGEASKRKPILVLKLGKTETGQKAALTHTASMAGDYSIYRAAFRQAGLVEAYSLQELVDYCVAFERLPEAGGNRVAIITNAGGTGAIAADESEKIGLSVVPMSKRLTTVFSEKFSTATFGNIVRANNPLDLSATATTEEFIKACKMVIESSEYDMMIAFPTHQPPTMDCGVVESMANLFHRWGRPMCVGIMGASEMAKWYHDSFCAAGVPSYPSPERAVRALGALAKYRTLRREAMCYKLPPTPTIPSSSAKYDWNETDKCALLAKYGIEHVKFSVMRSEREAKNIARDLGFPLVCKLMSSEILHKLELGGVILDVMNTQGLVSSYRKLRRRQSAMRIPFRGILVQQMIKGGLELILGSTTDAAFGPTVIFGVGGTYTELLGDYSVGIAPVSKGEARRMIDGLRMKPLLEGYRRGIRLDLNDLASMISSFSYMLYDHPSIREVEINPLITDGKRMLAADIRVIPQWSSTKATDM